MKKPNRITPSNSLTRGEVAAPSAPRAPESIKDSVVRELSYALDLREESWNELVVATHRQREAQLSFDAQCKNVASLHTKLTKDVVDVKYAAI